ncbi:hypothetical protein [Nannocystis pusilla]|uniref:hypothetical protein n=1 Tax=Nannocystis pusilla TaxID=889268 RepID=UPI003B76AD8A
MNLRAGRKAKAAAAFHAAAALFAAGEALLAPDRWDTQYALAYDLTFEHAHAAYVTSSFDEAELRIDALMTRARTVVERAAVVELAVAFHMTRGHCARAVEIGLPFLRASGIALPIHPTDAEVEEETESVWQALGDRAIADLIDLPPMTHPEIQGIMNVLIGVSVPAYFVDPMLMYLAAVRMIRLSLLHGNAELSSQAYVSFATQIGPKFGRYKEAYEFGKLSYDLASRGRLLTAKSIVYYAFANYIVFWRHHYREILPYTRSGFEVAVESGDLNYACYHCILASEIPLLCGEPLEDVLREVERRFDFVRKTGYAFVHRILLSVHYLIQSLRGRPVRFSMLDGSELDQDAFEKGLDPADFQSAYAYYYSAKAQALFVLGSPRGGRRGDRRQRRVPVEERRQRVDRRELLLPRARPRRLLRRGVTAVGPARGAVRLRAAARRVGGELPGEFFHKHALVRAELARLRGHDTEAPGLYEQAVASAREHGFVQIEAIACERAAAFYRARGLTIPADAYLQRARAGYFRWGAHAKVEQLDQRHPHLVERKPMAPTLTFAVRAEQFDVLSVVKASQTISGSSSCRACWRRCCAS